MIRSGIKYYPVEINMNFSVKFIRDKRSAVRLATGMRQSQNGSVTVLLFSSTQGIWSRDSLYVHRSLS